MINPDQMYTVRQLQHHDLRAEAAAYRVEQKCAHQRGGAARLAHEVATTLEHASTARRHRHPIGEQCCPRLAYPVMAVAVLPKYMAGRGETPAVCPLFVHHCVSVVHSRMGGDCRVLRRATSSRSPLWE
jgi:hypothetical protein